VKEVQQQTVRGLVPAYQLLLMLLLLAMVWV
jgi:hypothetical protein